MAARHFRLCLGIFQERAAFSSLKIGTKYLFSAIFFEVGGVTCGEERGGPPKEGASGGPWKVLRAKDKDSGGFDASVSCDHDEGEGGIEEIEHRWREEAGID